MNKTIFRKIYSRDCGDTPLLDSESQLAGKVLVYTQLTHYTYTVAGLVAIQYVNRLSKNSQVQSAHVETVCTRKVKDNKELEHA